MAYARALQHWAEKTDLPVGGRPHLLAESLKELQEEMRCYLSFSDEEVLKGMDPLEEKSAIPTEEANPQSAMTPASTPEEQVTVRAVREQAAERKSPKFLWLREGITPLPICGGCQADAPSVKRSKTKALQLRRKDGLSPPNQITEGDNHTKETPSPTTRVRSHLPSDANSLFPGSDDMSKER